MRRPVEILWRLLSLWRKYAAINDLFHNDFIADINLINFNRLRIWSYFLSLLVVSQLYSDFFLSEFWSTGQINDFMILDLILGGVTCYILFIVHYKPPKTSDEIRPIHKNTIIIYILFHVVWGSSVSIVESSTANGVPTYLLGVFSAATLFFTRGIVLLLFLLISLVTLFAGLFITGMPFNLIFTQYSTTVVLIILAWIISRALYRTRQQTFLATKELELARNNLDNTVKIRTAELIDTNEKLVAEIKERKRYEKILELEKKRAQEADRLKSVFLANMSHEIRTPLNGILGFGDLLQNHDVPPDKRSRYLEIISSNSHQLLKIIDDLMDISMIESNQLKINKINFTLSNLFPDALEFFKNFLKVQKKEHITLISSGMAGAANSRVFSDPARLQQVLYNLLTNSIKFTENGCIRFGGKIENDFALIYVEDTGIGVQQEISKVIFKPFRQGEETITRSYGGTGLGLSISRGIIELLNGMIWVDASYQQGALFCFSIPVNEEVINSNIFKHPRDFELLQNKSVLIIDDNIFESTFITDIFENNKTNLSWIKFEKLVSVTKETFPELIVYDTDKTSIDMPAIISNIRNTFEGVPLIILAPDSMLDNLSVIETPDNFKFAKPANIQCILIKCVELLYARVV